MPPKPKTYAPISLTKLDKTCAEFVKLVEINEKEKDKAKKKKHLEIVKNAANSIESDALAAVGLYEKNCDDWFDYLKDALDHARELESTVNMYSDQYRTTLQDNALTVVSSAEEQAAKLLVQHKSQSEAYAKAVWPLREDYSFPKELIALFKDAHTKKFIARRKQAISKAKSDGDPVSTDVVQTATRVLQVAKVTKTAAKGQVKAVATVWNKLSELAKEMAKEVKGLKGNDTINGLSERNLDLLKMIKEGLAAKKLGPEQIKTEVTRLGTMAQGYKSAQVKMSDLKQKATLAKSLVQGPFKEMPDIVRLSDAIAASHSEAERIFKSMAEPLKEANQLVTAKQGKVK